MKRMRLICFALATLFATSVLVAGCAPSDQMKPNVKPEEKEKRRDKSGED